MSPHGDGPAPTESDVADADEGGDPACWLHLVCPDCGRVADARPPGRCTGCGAPLTD